jgi:hypothetical protein
MKVLVVVACVLAVAAGKAVDPNAPLRKNLCFAYKCRLVITNRRKDKKPRDLHLHSHSLGAGVV